MRGGSANNIYVIPAPDKLTFRAATLLAAACCILALLLLISNLLMSSWNKIGEGNGRKEETERDHDSETPASPGLDITRIEERQDREETQGTNDQCTCHTDEEDDTRNRRIRSYLAIPIFGAIILAILAIGEVNFFSPQVRYQTEPMRSIGQWAPIVGTWLALLGSMYMVLAKDFISETAKKRETTSSNNDENGHEPAEPTAPSIHSPVDLSCPTCGRACVSGDRSCARESRGLKFLDCLTEWRLKGVRKMIDVIERIGTARARQSTALYDLYKELWPHTPGERRKNPKLNDTKREFRSSTRQYSRSANPSPSRSGSVGPKQVGGTDTVGPLPSLDSPSLARSPSDLEQLEAAVTFSESIYMRDQRSSVATARRDTFDSLRVPLSQSPSEQTFPMDSLPPRSPPATLKRSRQGRPSITTSDYG
ncbi:hypothetical protein H2200_003327 [Cladophialophora chaetospira]|uniref:Uncharacterized protein n=1 Tax=Cladophialophora chaetospira TaxID=386627 RepID=A0AA39CM63_9EURO|nr:hypothetical protein H2200_003327 [Cladophialophora chaetospira]